VSLSLPSFSDEGGNTTSSTSFSFLYGELRAGIETKIGGLLAGGVFQLPIFYSGSGTGANITGSSIYGSLGVAF